MAKFHFVEDYERLVDSLLRTYPIDEAMSRAVGGEYELFGKIEVQLLADLGLEDGMRLIDLGCGSGRLAYALGRRFDVSYLGTDIVQALLDYAKSKAPENYQFRLHRELSIPAPDSSADLICAFSLFTHLLHSETFIYLTDAVRVLKPNGRLVFSFLEFGEPGHWPVFETTVAAQQSDNLPHLNTFIERNVIEIWASHLGLSVDQFVSGTTPVWEGHNLGQAVTVLRKSTK